MKHLGILTTLYLVLLGLLYRDSYTVMVKWWNGEDYNYCYIVPLVVAYLMWEKRPLLARLPTVPSWGGLAALLPGIALFWLGELGGEYFTIYLSSWLLLTGLLWLHLGWSKLRAIAFPLLFLLAMFPLPNLIFNNVSLKLKILSSQLGVAMMRLSGLTAYREGNVIDLGFTQLQVVDACSGLRYLLPLLILGILLAYYFRAARWKKGLLIVSTIPITVFTNSLRIASVGFLYQFWGAAVAEGFFHDFSGWLIFMVSLGLLLLEMWLLNRMFREPPAAAKGESPLPTGIGTVPFPWGKTLVALALLAVSSGLTRTVDFREKKPLARPLAGFPMVIGQWQGARSGMDQLTLEALHLSDYLLVDFHNPQGRVASLYVAYNESQRKGESSHSPASCLPGSGWVFEESGLAAITTASGTIEVRRAFMQKSGERMLVYYWFPQRGRILTNMVQLKLYAFWDALTLQRTDGALVRLITPVDSAEQVAAAEERLRDFALQTVPVLNTFLPGR